MKIIIISIIGQPETRFNLSCRRWGWHNERTNQLYNIAILDLMRENLLRTIILDVEEIRSS